MKEYLLVFIFHPRTCFFNADLWVIVEENKHFSFDTHTFNVYQNMFYSILCRLTFKKNVSDFIALCILNTHNYIIFW